MKHPKIKKLIVFLFLVGLLVYLITLLALVDIYLDLPPAYLLKVLIAGF